MQQLPQAVPVGNVPHALKPVIWDLICKIAEHRPLTPAEVRWRRLTAPRPWRDVGVDRSTWYRRRKRALLASQQVEAA